MVECKELRPKKSIVSFWISNEFIRIKESENSPAILVLHINDLVKRFNSDALSRDGNMDEF